MATLTRPNRDLSPQETQRLEIAAQQVIQSARSSDNSTGINWRRLVTSTISEHYLAEYPELSNQQIALRETLEEVEKRIIDHGMDIARMDNTELQGMIEDVLDDILDFMVHDAQASSESDTDSSRSEDSDGDFNSGSPPNAQKYDVDDPPGNTRSAFDDGDASHAHQGQDHPHHEAVHVISSDIAGSSPSGNFGPHLPVDPDRPSPLTSIEDHVSESTHQSNAVILSQRREHGERREQAIASPAADTPAASRRTGSTNGGTQERSVNCCSTM